VVSCWGCRPTTCSRVDLASFEVRARALEQHHQSSSGDNTIEYRGRRRQQFQGVYLRESIVLYWRVKKLCLELALDKLTDCVDSVD
jgi:hypothetical protein